MKRWKEGLQATPRDGDTFLNLEKGCLFLLTATITRNKRGGLNHWTIHDLRRTLITQMAELSVPLHVVEKVAGHELGGVLAVYNRYSYFDEQREALEKWGQRGKQLG